MFLHAHVFIHAEFQCTDNMWSSEIQRTLQSVNKKNAAQHSEVDW